MAVVYRYLVLMDLLVVGADIAPALLVVARSAMVGVKQSCWYLVTVKESNTLANIVALMQV